HQVRCTDKDHEDLSTGFPQFEMHKHWNGRLNWNRIELQGSFVIPACPNLLFTPFPLRSAAPPNTPPRFDPHPGDNIGLLV
ncbi:MBL fold metallo-hydrolase, partial [Pseudomonas syringae pv. tagetis]|uniref:MBL fold metallo-hydrolase n=1 Tax=Pseudomonas syringae group genomosp. 7 TaxID=251699 RepID=UPI00376F47F0